MSEKRSPGLWRQKSTIFQSNPLSWAPTHGHQKWSRCTPDLVTWFASVSLRRKLEHHYIKPPVDSKTRINVNWYYQELSKWSKWPEKENHQWDRPRKQAQKRDTYPGDRNLEVLQLCPNLEQPHANVVPDLPIGPVTEAWRDDSRTFVPRYVGVCVLCIVFWHREVCAAFVRIHILLFWVVPVHLAPVMGTLNLY